MRRTGTLPRAGLAVAAALGLLTACGGSGGNDSASGSSTASSSASSSARPTSGGAASGSTFCTQAKALVTQVQSTLTSQTDPSTLPTALQEVANSLHAIRPPSEIASDWTSFADDIGTLGQAYATTDFNDSQSAAAFQQTATQLQGKLTAEGAHVESYLSSRCGIEGSTSAPASTS
jgi:hypothetical protein